MAAHLFRTNPEVMRELQRRHEDDEPTETEPEPAKPKVAPGAVPVTTVRGPDGSMRVQGARVLFHKPSDSESEETTASDDSGDDEDDEGIRPWDPD